MKLPVLSHSFLNDWDNCPRKAFRKYIKKDLPKFVQTREMAWGNTVHTAFEVRIKHGTAFPKGMEKFEALAAPLDAAGAIGEQMLGMRADGSVCDFFAQDVWLRGKIDARVSKGAAAAIFDWKSGKRREDRAELETHAVLLRAYDSRLVKITAHYVWLQDNEVGRAHDVSDTGKKLDEIRKTMATVERCLSDNDFQPQPNPLCGWCDVMDCEHNRKGRT